MWADISPKPGVSLMPERVTRFLAFVDLLATSHLYGDSVANAARIIDRRMELEHAIHKRLQEPVASGRIEIGVFSDTILLAGRSLDDVLAASATLLDFVFTKTVLRGDPSDLRLLRGGVSVGPELRTGYLRPGHGIHVIPFFDGGLGFAFEQENIRRGSRLFLSKDLGQDQVVPDLRQFMFRWQTMTGAGRPTGPVTEFLWPAFIYRDSPERLLNLVHRAFALWRQHPHSISGAVSPDFYRETLYQFDESIKVCIRSLISFKNDPKLHALARKLTDLLPSDGNLMDDTDINYLWGVWFQVVYVLVLCELDDQFTDIIARTIEQLLKRKYLDKFVAEMDFPDYEVMRRILPEATQMEY